MRLRNKGRTRRSVITLLGRITYERTCLAPADGDSREALAKLQAGRYVYPVDDLLGVSGLPHKVTVPMMVAMAKEAVRSNSYGRAAKVIREHFRVEVSQELVREVTDLVGAAVLADDRQRADEAKGELEKRVDRRTVRRRDDDVLYVECDGAMVNIRRGGGQGNEWVECKVGIVFHARDIHEYTDRNGKPRRVITRKAICGHIGSYKDFQWLLLGNALLYDVRRCAHVVFISDGAKWIATLVEAVFPGATHILDLAHAREHVGTFGRWAIRDDGAAEMWIEEAKALVNDGRIDELLAALEPWRGVRTPEGVSNLHTYVTNHRDMMRYDEFRAAGYFLGSGAIESANKYGTRDRMKLTGMSWGPETAQRMLALKTRLESDRWHEVEPAVRSYLASLREAAYPSDEM